MVQNLEGIGFTVVPFGQGFKDMFPPTKELMKLPLEQKLTHGGHPVLRWMMDNIYIRTNPAGNVKSDKEKSTEKINGAVATIMALDRAIRCGNNTGSSAYDDRGILLCLYCMKTQIFLDDNKRASVIFTNHYLISHGGGFLVIPEKEVPEFKRLLVKYYAGKDIAVIATFMKEHCWKTIES